MRSSGTETLLRFRAEDEEAEDDGEEDKTEQGEEGKEQNKTWRKREPKGDKKTSGKTEKTLPTPPEQTDRQRSDEWIEKREGERRETTERDD